MTAKEQQATSRRRRLTAALRDNLKRRKAQAQGRKEGRSEPRPVVEPAAERAAKPHESA